MDAGGYDPTIDENWILTETETEAEIEAETEAETKTETVRVIVRARIRARVRVRVKYGFNKFVPLLNKLDGFSLTIRIKCSMGLISLSRC